MTFRYLGCALLALIALDTAAGAQIYDNNEVVVNPQASGSQVLLYPDNKHGRVQRPLLQPGDPDPNAPIRLHMPYPHRAVHKIAKAAAKPKTQTAAASPPPPQQQSTPQPDMLNFGPVPGESAASMVGTEPKAAPIKTAQPKPQPAKKVAVVQKPVAPPPKPVPAKTQIAKTQPAKSAPPVAAASNSDMGFLSGNQMSTATTAPPPAKPSRTASVEPSDLKGMTKRSSIPFPSGAEEPQPEVLDTVKTLSGELNSALNNGSARVELEAFGGKQNDKSSEARRLSLKRALIVRQLLIDEGVPSERIDVRAMGGASEGSLDRVDIFVRA